MEHIFIVNINGLRDGSIYQTWFDQMSKERRNKIVSHKMEGDRLRSLGAGIVLGAILKQYGLDPVKTQLEYGDNGKPYMEYHCQTDETRTQKFQYTRREPSGKDSGEKMQWKAV